MKSQLALLVLPSVLLPSASAVLSGFNSAHLPYQSDPKVGQYGYNQCGTQAKPDSKCQ